MKTAYLLLPRAKRREKVDGMTGKTGKYIVWEYSYYFKYAGESPSQDRTFEVRIRVATLDTNPRAKGRLLYYISTQLMEYIDIDISSPDWSSRSIGIRQVGRADFKGMKYRIIGKDPMHPFVWPKTTWGWVSDPTSMRARREMRKHGYA